MTMLFLVPVLIFVIGVIWAAKPPKRINALYGYRTKSSMKNERTWMVANYMCSRIFITLGVVGLAVNILIYLYGKVPLNSGLYAFIHVLLLMMIFPITEMSIKLLNKNYEEN